MLALVVVPGLMVAGLGLLVAAGAGWTVYRDDRRLRRRLLLLGAAVTVVSVVLAVLAVTGSTELEVGPPVVVRP